MAAPHLVCMKRTRSAKTKRRIYIKEWRKSRELTQEQLAERLGTTHTTIGRLERGVIPYDRIWLEALAEALRCEPADLIMRNPLDPEGIWSIWENLSPPQKQQAVAVIQALRKTG